MAVDFILAIIGNLLASGNVEEESDNSNNYSSGDESDRDENENAYIPYAGTIAWVELL